MLFNEKIIISNIPLKVPEREILRRLGYPSGKYPDETSRKMIEVLTEEAMLLINPAGIYKMFDVEIEPGCVVISKKYKIKSLYLLNLLKNCRIIFLMASTLGDAVYSRITEYVSSGLTISKGVILDAAASELAEESMEYIHNIIKNNGAVKGYKTTIRYSPGYKDFSLSEQKLFDELLDLKSIGVEVTDHFLLKPEKTITAIAGWEL